MEEKQLLYQRNQELLEKVKATSVMMKTSHFLLAPSSPALKFVSFKCSGSVHLLVDLLVDPKAP